MKTVFRNILKDLKYKIVLYDFCVHLTSVITQKLCQNKQTSRQRDISFTLFKADNSVYVDIKDERWRQREINFHSA